MARAIDKDKLITSMAWHDQQGMISSIDDILDIIEAFPTLTPPNEALTIEQLRQMDEPVWCSCKPIEGGNGYWCLCRYGKIVTPSGNIFDVDKIPHWMFYRRPPEGEGGDADHA